MFTKTKLSPHPRFFNLPKLARVKLSLLMASTFVATAPVRSAEPCQCTPSTAEDTLLSGTSSSQGSFQLLMDQPVRTKGVYHGSLCTAQADQVSQVKLWMPDMGHGSSPTTLEMAGDSCLRVKKINFMMPGLWELRIQFKDGSTSQVALEVP